MISFLGSYFEKSNAIYSRAIFFLYDPYRYLKIDYEDTKKTNRYNVRERSRNISKENSTQNSMGNSP